MKIAMMLFSLTVLISLSGWAQSTTPSTQKSSTTTVSKAMNITGTLSSDGKTFVADKGNKTWTIDNPTAVKADEGHHVSLNATENTSKDTLHVNSAKMVAKSKTSSSNNTSKSANKG